MNIITDEVKNGRFQDGIKTLLELDDTSFAKVLKILNPNENGLENINFYYTSDNCESPEKEVQIGLEEKNIDGQWALRGYYADGVKRSVHSIFEMLAELKGAFQKDSKERGRIECLLGTRGLEAYKGYYVHTTEGANADVVDKAFEILSDDELFKKFLDYSNHKDEFQIEGVENPKKEILKCIAKTFGGKRETGELVGLNKAFVDFYIPEMDKYKEKVVQLYDKFNYQRYTNSRYEFNAPLTFEEYIRKNDEPDFTINPELREAVYKDMPDDLSVEEEVVFVYSRLCKELLYNEEYMYREKLDDSRYESDFSKEHLESIKPGSKITCYDFSRIFAKMVNDMDRDVEAVIISPGQERGHFLVGVFSEKMSAKFDAINLDRGEHTDDLMKAKAGIPLKGITYCFDDYSALKKAVRKIYPMAVGKEPTRLEKLLGSMDDDTEELGQKDNLETKIQTFISLMKEKNIVGNEFVQSLTAAMYVDYFKEPLEKAYVGRPENRNGQKHFTRMIFLRPRDYYARKNNHDLYMIDTGDLSFEVVPPTELAEKLESGEYVYEDDVHKMKGIDD